MVQDFEFSVNHVPFSIVPFPVCIFNVLHVNSGAIFVVEIVLLEDGDFGLELFAGVPPLKVFFNINQTMQILKIDTGPDFLFQDDIVDNMAVVVDLSREVFVLENSKRNI